MKRWLCLLTAALLLAGCSLFQRPARQVSGPVQSGEQSQNIDTPAEQQTPAGDAQTPDTPEAGEASAASDGAFIEILTLPVPEGYTLARIGMTLEDMGVCTAEAFIDAAQTADFSNFPLVARQQADENRCFRLEGYLFPATYQIYSGEAPEAIIRRMLETTEAQFGQALLDEIEESGYTVDEILTLASIIEKEAFGHQHMPAISSVLHNRLDIDMQLQCDVTIVYVEGAIKPFIDGDVNRYNEHYNTYKCPALPAGPICNPGMDAILAALRPADTDMLFFVTDQEQNYYYAATWEEHEENLRTVGLL